MLYLRARASTSLHYRFASWPDLPGHRLSPNHHGSVSRTCGLAVLYGVRSGPAVTYKRIGFLKANSRHIRSLGCQKLGRSEWCNIIYRGTEGWDIQEVFGQGHPVQGITMHGNVQHHSSTLQTGGEPVMTFNLMSMGPDLPKPLEDPPGKPVIVPPEPPAEPPTETPPEEPGDVPDPAPEFPQVPPALPEQPPGPPDMPPLPSPPIEEPQILTAS